MFFLTLFSRVRAYDAFIKSAQNAQRMLKKKIIPNQFYRNTPHDVTNRHKDIIMNDKNVTKMPALSVATMILATITLYSDCLNATSSQELKTHRRRDHNDMVLVVYAHDQQRDQCDQRSVESSPQAIISWLTRWLAGWLADSSWWLLSICSVFV